MSETDKILQTLHPLERKVLPTLKKHTELHEVAKAASLQSVEAMRAFQWLQNKKIIKLNESLQNIVKLDANGKLYKEQGLPEVRFVQAISKEITLDAVQKKANLSKEEASVCLGLLRRSNIITLKKEDNKLKISLTQEGEQLKSQKNPIETFLKGHFPRPVKDLNEQEQVILKDLTSRKKVLKVDVQKTITAELTKQGKDLLKHKITDDYQDRLTPDMLLSGDWKDKKLRRYDVTINVPPIHGGKRHFVDQAIRYIKNIWLELGFQEMQGGHVQTAFWDLDALFVPQDHPAREMQDTFYIKDPKEGTPNKETIKRVKAMHEHGGKLGSTGWKSKWSEKTAKQNMLRTHNTVLSALTISKLKKQDLPAKFFSVGKVYRNEALSWKHLFEFIQVEGIVVDPNANFKNLQGYLKEFFGKMGFPDVRIRPAHFPYTEPSAEVDVWHPTKNQWVELGGSGVFRPEVVEPLLGFECPVLAWGLGMERTIMEYYKFTDVRQIYANNLKEVRQSKLWMK